MKQDEFVERYRAALPTPPPELELDIGVFVAWESAHLAGFPLSSEDAAWLRGVGLPRDAAPFLSFRSVSPRDQYAPADLLEIGFTGYGDLICVEPSTRAVIYLNHDRDDERVLINSSIPALAESLCIYREQLNLDRGDEAFALIRNMDPAVSPDSFWGTETVA